MINYNIINEFIEKLKAGKTTASDINAIAEAYKNGELTNTVNLIEVENIKAIPSSVLEDLNCGDIVVKNENGNKHAYVVTYKEHHQGICLTYVDASMCETQSYDYVTDTWTYNSEDKVAFVNYSAGTGINITNGVISGAYTAGANITIEDGVITGTGASKLYQHCIKMTNKSSYTTAIFTLDLNIYNHEDAVYNNYTLLSNIPAGTLVSGIVYHSNGKIYLLTNYIGSSGGTSARFTAVILADNGVLNTTYETTEFTIHVGNNTTVSDNVIELE